MAFQVIGGEGRPDPDGGCQFRCRLDLVAADFDHQPVRSLGAGRLALQGQFGGRDADIAAEGRIQSGFAEEVMHQMGHRGLAVGARDADPGGSGRCSP